ncbi:MAG: hypothetical protein RL722_1530 [Pseudomonadota bacterium]|jgi:GNAT superfamily N-acetyltransferase
MSASTPFHLRPAEPRDVSAIVGLIQALADYEQLTHMLEVTAEQLESHLFGPRPWAECLVAEAQEADAGGTVGVVGFALFFPNYSTFLAKPGLHLEDLFVLPAWRGRGIGRALLARLAEIAVERGCGRLEWAVLDWNQSAIDVYEGLGAEVLPDWRICRVAGPALASFGKR